MAGNVHLEGDEEITMEDLKKNQRQLNGHVSMLLKVFNTGGDWKHQARMRDSMISDSMAVFPLWLLFKCHDSGYYHSMKKNFNQPSLSS